mgnify:CR=1 FL=1
MPKTEGGVVVAVDDDVAVLASLKFALEVDGFVVRGYRSAEELLADLPGSASCLVVDLRLPGIDGLALVAAVRKRGMDCPAILMTTDPPLQVRREAEAAGLAIVEKPLLGNALADMIRAVLAAPSRRG